MDISQSPPIRHFVHIPFASLTIVSSVIVISHIFSDFMDFASLVSLVHVCFGREMVWQKEAVSRVVRLVSHPSCRVG